MNYIRLRAHRYVVWHEIIWSFRELNSGHPSKVLENPFMTPRLVGILNNRFRG